MISYPLLSITMLEVIIGHRAKALGAMLDTLNKGYQTIWVSAPYNGASFLVGAHPSTFKTMWDRQKMACGGVNTEFIDWLRNAMKGIERPVITDCFCLDMLNTIRMNFACRVICAGKTIWGNVAVDHSSLDPQKLYHLFPGWSPQCLMTAARFLSPTAPYNMAQRLTDLATPAQKIALYRAAFDHLVEEEKRKKEN